MKFSDEQLALWSGGAWNKSPVGPLLRVVHDSREIKPGDIYLAVKGERVDGHQFLEQVQHLGASAAIVSELDTTLPLPQLLVEDTLLALQAVATGFRSQLKARVIGITGSVGKTTVKEMLATVLSGVGPTSKTQGNWNNNIGLPLSLLAAPLQTQFLVLEAGMNAPGEIAPLCEILKPNAGCLTELAAAHQAQFDSLEDIATEKAALLRSLPRDGFVVLDRLDPWFDFFKAQCKCRVVTVAMEEEADYTGYPAWHRPGELEVAEAASGLEYGYRMPGPGPFMLRNGLKVVAMARELGVPPGEVFKGLLKYQPVGQRWREERVKGILFINDAYNASPLAMKSSVEAFAEHKGSNKKWLVLGGMHELGAIEEEAHLQLGKDLVRWEWQGLIAVGPLAQGIAKGALESGMDPSRVIGVPDVTVAAEYLASQLESGDSVLVKASRIEALDMVIRNFKENA